MLIKYLRKPEMMNTNQLENLLEAFFKIQDLRQDPQTSLEDVYKMLPSTKQYCSKGIPYAAFVAIKDSKGNIRFGWSKVNRQDTFSKKEAKRIAVSRAQNSRYPNTLHNDKMNEAMKKEFEAFQIRAHKYFKI